MKAKLRKEQAGFRGARFCTDQIASLRIIIEQSLEWQSSLHVSVDFKKRFTEWTENDLENPKALWHSLEDGKHKSFYEDNSCRVIHNTDLPAHFTVNTVVRQGCILSPLMFSLFIDWVLKSTMEQPRGIQWTLMQKLPGLFG